MTSPRHITLIHVASALASSMFVWLLADNNASSPAIFPDEMCFLGWARYLAGERFYSMGGAAYCHPLYPSLLTPIQLLSQQSSVQYEAAIAFNALLSGACMPIARFLAVRHFGMDNVRGWCAGILVACYPGVVAYSSYAWPESLLYLLSLLWLWAWCRFVEQRSATRLAMFSVSTLLLYAAHPRMIGLFLILLVTIFWWNATSARHDRRKITLTIALGCALFFLAMTRLKAHMLSVAWLADVVDPIGRTTNVLADLTPSLSKFSGQLLFALLATMGLAWLPLIILLQSALARCVPLRHRIPHAEDLKFLAAPLGMIVTAALGALFLSAPTSIPRFDFFFYGRYIGPFVMLSMLPGLALAGRLKGRSTLGILFLGIAICLLFISFQGPEEANMPYSRIHVVGVLSLLDLLYQLAGTSAFTLMIWSVVGIVALFSAFGAFHSYGWQFGITLLSFFVTFSMGAAPSRESLTERFSFAGVEQELSRTSCRVIWAPPLTSRVRIHQFYRLQYTYPHCRMQFLSQTSCTSGYDGLLVTTNMDNACIQATTSEHILPDGLVIRSIAPMNATHP